MKKLGLLLSLIASMYAKDVYATFNVEAYQEATIGVAAQGIIEKIYANVGDYVQKDHYLLKLDNLDLVKSKLISEADLQSLNVELKYAKRSLDRFKELKDVVDKEAYDQVSYKVELLEAKKRSAEAGLEYKQTLINKTYLKMPFNGVITEKFVEIGESASGKCFTVVDNSKVKLILTFDEKYWNTIKKGSKFKYRVDGIEKEHIGTISKVYPSANQQSRTIKAEVITKNLMPGLFGDGYIEVK